MAETHCYPPCPITERYPALIRIAPEERPAWLEQAEAGIPLTAEQATRLRRPGSAGGILVPVDGCLSVGQLNITFKAENRHHFGAYLDWLLEHSTSIEPVLEGAVNAREMA